MGKRNFDQRQKLKILKSAEKIGMLEAAKAGGIHYTTLYEWRHRYEAMGEEGFLNYKPAYPGRGAKKITAKQEKAILNECECNPEYGPGQIRNQLRRQGIAISIRTIRKVMEANGYKLSDKKSVKDKCVRFEAGRPLELAQMDITDFYISKQKVHLILLLDDFSRFILGFRLLSSTSSEAVREVVEEAVNRYGKMEELLTDRGFVFFSWRGINRFEKFLELEGIDHTHARPHHPQTLGKVEACNKSIKRELLSRVFFNSVEEARSAIAEWVEKYNYRRSHQGIGGLLTPSERFHGHADQVLDNIKKSIDITDEKGVVSERCLASLVMRDGGKFEMYVMGRQLMLMEENDVDKFSKGRSVNSGQ